MFHFISRVLFIIGLLFGIFLAILLQSNNRNSKKTAGFVKPLGQLHYEKWFRTKFSRKPLLFDKIRYDNNSHYLESNYLYDQVQTLCLILVRTPKNAQAAESTWAKNCNAAKLLNLYVEKRKMPVKRRKEDTSWVVLCKALVNVPAKYQWVVVVYDYTFVVLENLRMFVASLDENDKYYLGHSVKFWSTVYNKGSAGYVLSRGSVETLQWLIRSEANFCTSQPTYRNQEDYYLGQHLSRVNITPVDTRDSYGLSTFHPYNLYLSLSPVDSHFKLSVFPYNCCSSHSITFQAIEGDKMYTYYYLLYTLQLFLDGNIGNKSPAKTVPDENIWKNFLRSQNIPLNISSEQYYKVWENLVDDPTSFARHMQKEVQSDYDQM